MDQQPAEEYEMDQHETENGARLIAICDTEVTVPTHRHVVMAPTGHLAPMRVGFEASI